MLLVGRPLGALAAPTNDAFAAAAVVGTPPFSASETTTEATRETDDPAACAPYEHPIWYRVTRTAAATLLVDTFGGSYDTVLAVYADTRGVLSQVACNDDAQGTSQSQVTFPAGAYAPRAIATGRTGNEAASAPVRVEIAAAPAP